MASTAKGRLGERLNVARTERGLTMAALANKANVSSALINDAEKGRHSPSTDKVEQLARALDVDPCWLAYGTGTKPDWHDKTS